MEFAMPPMLRRILAETPEFARAFLAGGCVRDALLGCAPKDFDVEIYGVTYEQVVADLGTMYSLAYRPANSVRDGRWRAIRIRVNRTNAVPRGKRGYYAN